MLVTIPLAIAFANSALANPLKRAVGELAVTVSGPSAKSVDSVEGLKFKAEITNTGKDAVKVLKYGTILDSLPTRSFTVTKNGTIVPFTGIETSIALNDGAFTTIESGKSVIVEHDVASLFDFASVGAGKFTFEPVTAFLDTGDQQDFVQSTVTSTSEPIEIEIKDVSRKETKRAVPRCNDSEKTSFIAASYTEAKQLASVALDYIQSDPNGQIYKDYFGANDPAKVVDILSAVANESGDRTLGCDDVAKACDGNVIAYTVVSTKEIHYCDIFFKEVDNGELCSSASVDSRTVRGGTTLHELTHALSSTVDTGYGCPANQMRPDSQKINNADNYNCFTTQVFASTQCSGNRGSGQQDQGQGRRGSGRRGQGRRQGGRQRQGFGERFGFGSTQC